jgi:hypothetical protein
MSITVGMLGNVGIDIGRLIAISADSPHLKFIGAFFNAGPLPPAASLSITSLRLATTVAWHNETFWKPALLPSAITNSEK